MTSHLPVSNIPRMRYLTLFVVLCSAESLLACSNRARHAEVPPPTGWEDEPAENTESAIVPDEDVVQKSARPFTGFRPLDGATFTDEQLITFLASADAICIGERHDQVLDHYAQLRLLEGLSERRTLRGFELGLALEMVRTGEQLTLDAYAQGRIGDEEFENLSSWRSEWGYPIQYYRPQLQLAASARVHLIALGVDRDFTRHVAEVGLPALDERKKAQIPEMNLESSEHRALFDGLMQKHPMQPGSEEKYYQAQVVWDESMAHSSASWLRESTPGRKLLIMAGSAHCHRTAIPQRLSRRTGATVVSVLPVEGAPRPAKEGSSSSPEERLAAGYDYQMVFAR